MGRKFEMPEIPKDGLSRCPYTGELFNQVGRLTVTDTLICLEGLFDISEDKRASGYTQKQIDELRINMTEEEEQKKKRSEITDFTRASQVRLIKKLSKWHPLNKLLIITLTYPRDFPDTRTAKKHLDRFNKKVLRDQPDWCGCWKLEYQNRGAPHFHFVIDGGLYKKPIAGIRKWVNDAWAYARDSSVNARTQVDYARDNKKAKYYLTKELGKSIQTSSAWRSKIEADVDHYGRFWGWINKKGMVLKGQEYYVPVKLAVEVRKKIKEHVLESMQGRGLIDYENGKLVYKYKGEEVDPDQIPTWQLFPNAEEVFTQIVEEIEEETGLNFYALARPIGTEPPD